MFADGVVMGSKSVRHQASREAVSGGAAGSAIAGACLADEAPGDHKGDRQKEIAVDHGGPLLRAAPKLAIAMHPLIPQRDTE
jgi:hypothetical protein